MGLNAGGRLRLVTERLEVDLDASTCFGSVLLDGKPCPAHGLTIFVVPGKPARVEMELVLHGGTPGAGAAGAGRGGAGGAADGP